MPLLLSAAIWLLILLTRIFFYLTEHINLTAPFKLDEGQILVGTNGQYTPAIGAALHFVDQFIHTV